MIIYSKAVFSSGVCFLLLSGCGNCLYNAYLQGNINGIGQLNDSVIVDALQNRVYQFTAWSNLRLQWLCFNLRNDSLPFFQDADIRRALLMGLDRRGMIDRILNGQGVIADVPLLPDSWAYYRQSAYRSECWKKQKTYLKNAGYVLDQEGSGIRRKDSTVFSFTLVHPDDDYHTRIAQSIQSDWVKLGVDVKLEAVPYDSLILDYLQPLTYQAALVDINYYRSPDPDPYPFWDQSEIAGGQNYSQWKNNVISQYLAEARVTRDQDERAKLYRNFQVIFIEDMPALPLFYPVYNFAIDNSIQGVRLDRCLTLATVSGM